MTDQDELEAARRALASKSEATEAVVATVRSASDGIRRIVEKNGYVSRFRGMIRGY